MDGGNEAAGGKQMLRFFLHYSGEDKGACEPAKLSAVEKETAGALRCGEIKPSLEPQCYPECGGGTQLVYPFTGKFNATVSQGFVGQAEVFLVTEAPDSLRVYATIEVGALSCWLHSGGGGRTMIATGEPMVPGRWFKFEGECNFGAGYVAGVGKDGGEKSAGGATQGTGSLRFVLNVNRLANFYVGHEGEHASWFQFAADPAEVAKPASKNETDPPAPSKKAPGVSGLMAAGGLLLVHALRRRDLMG